MPEIKQRINWSDLTQQKGGIGNYLNLRDIGKSKSQKPKSYVKSILKVFNF